MAFDQTVLPNGLKLIGEHIPFYRTAAVGLYVGSGSQYETPEEAGISHFIEHMVFKGTEHYTARQISEKMDAVGGMLNAYTAKECTCFYTKVVNEHLPLAMDVIAELAVRPKFDPVEMEKEKGVVLEEIAMAEDTPEDLVHEVLMTAFYGDQPLARPILGTEEAIEGYTTEDLRAYWRKLYCPQNAVLAVAGNYDWQTFIDLAERYFGTWSGDDYEPRKCPVQPAQPKAVAKEKQIEQMHLCLGYPGVAIGDPTNYELNVFNIVFGGAMSSRLFQRIREDCGMAYSVYSYPNGYLGSGMLSVYAATNPENAEKVYSMILEEAAKLRDEGITREEFDMAVQQLRASFILGLESTSGKMQAVGRRLLLIGDKPSDDEILARIERIRYEDVCETARKCLSAPHALAVIGEGAQAFVDKVCR